MSSPHTLTWGHGKIFRFFLLCFVTSFVAYSSATIPLASPSAYGNACVRRWMRKSTRQSQQQACETATTQQRRAFNDIWAICRTCNIIGFSWMTVVGCREEQIEKFNNSDDDDDGDDDDDDEDNTENRLNFETSSSTTLYSSTRNPILMYDIGRELLYLFFFGFCFKCLAPKSIFLSFGNFIHIHTHAIISHPFAWRVCVCLSQEQQTVSATNWMYCCCFRSALCHFKLRWWQKVVCKVTSHIYTRTRTRYTANHDVYVCECACEWIDCKTIKFPFSRTRQMEMANERARVEKRVRTKRRTDGWTHCKSIFHFIKSQTENWDRIEHWFPSPQPATNSNGNSSQCYVSTLRRHISHTETEMPLAIRRYLCDS